MRCSHFTKLLSECNRLALRPSPEITQKDTAYVLTLARTLVADGEVAKGEHLVLAGVALLWVEAEKGELPKMSFSDLHKQLGQYVQMAGSLSADRSELQAALDRQLAPELFSWS